MTSENSTIFPTNSKIKMTKNVLKTLRLKKLREMNQGTNDVESYCKNISDENYRSMTRKMQLPLNLYHYFYFQPKQSRQNTSVLSSHDRLALKRTLQMSKSFACFVIVDFPV